MEDPIQPTDDEARNLARDLIANARFGALAVTDPQSGFPLVTRIGLVPGTDGMPLALISALAAHTQALRADARCGLLLGEPGAKGDPLTHPRLSLQGYATFVPRQDTLHAELAAHYVAINPKAKLYIGFADFSLVHIVAEGAFLNGGFGRAYRLSASDLRG